MSLYLLIKTQWKIHVFRMWQIFCETAMENITSLWIYTVCCRSHFRTALELRLCCVGASPAGVPWTSRYKTRLVRVVGSCLTVCDCSCVYLSTYYRRIPNSNTGQGPNSRVRSSARVVRMVESNETENWNSRVRSTWRSNGISYTTCMRYCQIALFTYTLINSLV